jgi:two-component system, chemotaxis family, response regulator Rcp1
MIDQRAILLVEDNPADARLTVEAFRTSDPDTVLEICEDGESALARLHDSALALPALVLLDLNLPGIDGREVLATIKSDARLRRLPVCVLTTSRAAEDVERAYDHHTNSYVVKPVDLNAFRDAIRRIRQFWFETAQLPASRSDGG